MTDKPTVSNDTKCEHFDNACFDTLKLVIIYEVNSFVLEHGRKLSDPETNNTIRKLLQEVVDSMPTAEEAALVRPGTLNKALQALLGAGEDTINGTDADALNGLLQELANPPAKKGDLN